MAYPFGTYNDDVVQCLVSCGIVYSRIVHATHRCDISEDWLRLHPACHRDDVWYATNIEVYDYVQAYRSLVFSADAKTVYNLSATEVFFSCGGMLFQKNWARL